MRKAIRGRYSVNSVYLFFAPWSDIIRAYDLSKIVSPNCPGEQLSAPTQLLSLHSTYFLLTPSAQPFFMLCSHPGTPFPKSLQSQFLPTFQNLAEAPSSTELLVLM